MARNNVHSGVYILPDQPVVEIWDKYEYARPVLGVLGIASRNDCGDRTVAQVVDGPHLACQLNTTAGYSGAPALDVEQWMLPVGPPAEGYYGKTPRPVSLNEENTALIRSDGLPQDFFSASDGRVGIRFMQASGGVDLLSCWPWGCFPRAREGLFGDGFLRFGHGGDKNVFERVTLWPFGFENRCGKDQQNVSRLVLERNTLCLRLESGTEPWVNVDLAACITDEHATPHESGRRWMRLGWDEEHSCYILYLVEVRNGFAGNLHCPPQMTVEMCREHKGFSPIDSWPDRVVAGNLYIAFDCDGAQPDQDGDVLRWRKEGPLVLNMAIGMSYSEAMENLNAMRGQDEMISSRRLKHAHQVAAAFARVEAPGHENLAAMAAWLPLQFEAFKLEDYMITGMMDFTYTSAIEVHHSLPGMMYMGDEDFVDRYLDFVIKPEHRGPTGNFSFGWNYDWTSDISYVDPCSCEYNYLMLCAMLQWRRENVSFTNKRYTPGKMWLKQMLAMADPETGLSTHYWGGDTTLEDFGDRNGDYYTSCHNASWYEVLRVWEIVAMQQGDLAFAEELRALADKVRASFMKVFYNAEHQAFVHYVRPDTMKQGAVLRSNFMGFGMYTSFVDELTTGMECELANSTLDLYWLPEWKGLREFSPHGSFSPTEWHYVGSPLDDMSPARLFRIARHRDALEAMRDMCEHTFGKFCTAGEVYFLRPPGRNDANAFNYALASRYQMLIENFFGVTTGPGGVGLCPVGLDCAMTLKGMRYGNSTWNISHHGKGSWPQRILIGGAEHKGAWCLPQTLSYGGNHDVEVHFSESAPTTPVLMEAAGLGLVESTVEANGRAATILLKGPGRALARYYSPSKPKVSCDGQSVPDNWQPTEKAGRVEVLAVDHTPVELRIEI